MDKRELRRRSWQALREAGVARFPGARGRIPNFTGAEAAAERLAGWTPWKRARLVKCNADLPQRAVRCRALREGKRVLLTFPRLQEERPFLLLDPRELGERQLWHASSVRGAFELGRALALEELERIDLVVTGCVAVARDGARLGKGDGFSDLEYALLREARRLSAKTPVATTAHPLQVARKGHVPMEAHDVPVDVYALPDRLVSCIPEHRKPARVRWSELDDDVLLAAPVLRVAHASRR